MVSGGQISHGDTANILTTHTHTDTSVIVLATVFTDGSLSNPTNAAVYIGASTEYITHISSAPVLVTFVDIDIFSKLTHYVNMK